MASRARTKDIFMQKLMQEKLKSEQAKNKILKGFNETMAGIMARNLPSPEGSGSDFTSMLSSIQRQTSQRATKQKKRRVRRSPPSRKQLLALARGRKILAKNRKTR